MSVEKTRLAEETMIRLFSECKPFSAHLLKWEDKLLPDKYDQNFFEYTGQPTKEEFLKALAYQKKRGDSFIKLEGDYPLEDTFGLEPSITLTMVLQTDTGGWRKNDKVVFGVPSLPELEAIELKHFGAIYGESFTKRNVHRLYEKLCYHGAYIGSTLVAVCYSFSTNGTTCIDGLIVDEAYRRQYIAGALIAHVVDNHKNNTVFLHADAEDTPKQMYLKMGFEITDYLYEYLCTDFAALPASNGKESRE